MKHISLYTLLSAALLMAACSSDNLGDQAQEVVREGNFTLNIHHSGERGGKRLVHRDLGDAYDYHLHDLCLFIYNTYSAVVSAPINSDGTTPIANKIYLTEDKFTEHTDRITDGHTGHEIDAYYVSAHFNIPEFKRSPFQHIVVVANMGDITGSCNTLADLRNYLPASAYNYSDGTYSNFAMGLYEEPEWVEHTEHPDNPNHFQANVTLERLSARVDFQLNHFPSAAAQTVDEHAPIPYNVEVGGNILARNWITHARLVNAMQKPSYTIRRTASSATETRNFTYLGNEETNAEGVATNYFITPYTADMSAYSAATLFGNTALETTRSAEFTSNERVISRQNGAVYGDDGQLYYIIGYPQENTLRTDQMLRQYATGILYRTVYEPATVWSLNSAGDGIESETAPLSTSVLSTGGVAAGGTLGSHYGKTFWMMEELVPQPTEANRVYFMSSNPDPDAAREEVAHAINIYKEQHPEVGYTDAQKFTDGVAYNYYWVRHAPSQGQGHPFTPMEYSVVRNNIYSVKIESFSGPGAPSTDPSMDNPDRIQPITYVHPWHPYEVEEIEM